LEHATPDSARWDGIERTVMSRVNPWLWRTSWDGIGSRIVDRRYDILNTLGYAEMSLGNYHESIELLTESANGLLRTHPYRFGTAATFEALGSAYDYVNHHERAQEAYSRALALMRIVAGDTSVAVARVLGHMVGPQFFSGNVRAALATVESAHEIAEATGDTVEIVAQLYALGYVTRRVGQVRRAQDAFTRALSLIDSSSATDPDLDMIRIMSHAERSACHLALGRQRFAEAEGALAYRLARRARRFNVVGQAAAAYAEALVARGEFALAIRLLEPAYASLWDPPVRANQRLLAARIARCLSRAHSALGHQRAGAAYARRAARSARSHPAVAASPVI
jgi:tetratricopeptide (TPR) repeat protein